MYIYKGRNLNLDVIHMYKLKIKVRLYNLSTCTGNTSDMIRHFHPKKRDYCVEMGQHYTYIKEGI